MSIIEKALGTLTEGEEQAKPIAPSALERRERDAKVNTLEKAAGNIVKDSSSSAATTPEEIPSPVISGNTNPLQEDFNSGDDASSRPLVKLPFDKMHENRMLTPGVPSSVIAEEYRTIKRPLLTNMAGQSAEAIKHPNLIMVTSALAGDGKTFTSINLALSIAMEQDKTVLFVDADTAKAEAGRFLGVPENSPGLIDVLERKGVTLEEVILHTNVPKLKILPAGNLHTHSNELLASESMHQLMLEMAERYSDRVIVFDSPPLLLTTEAGVLASFMGQIVFVVRADQTPNQAVVDALQHIGQDKAVGMVLNEARNRGNKLYGYGYGYGYGRDEYSHRRKYAARESL